MALLEAWEPLPGRLWILYARAPGGRPPRRWRGLVGYGRLDIASRVILASLYPGGRLLPGSGLVLFLDRGGGEGRAIGFLPRCLPEEMTMEREAGELLLRSLRGEAGGCGPPVEAALAGLLRLLRRRGFRVIGLSEEGRPLRSLPAGRVALLLGSRVDPPPGLPVDERVRVGCRSYLASTVAAYVNAQLLLAQGAGRG